MTPVQRRWLILLLVALAARALTFGNPIVHADEQFYFTVAREMWRGQLPYLDIWDRKPLGLFLLYMPAAALPLPWGTLAYQGMALACVVAAAGLVARFADRAGWRRGALPAAVAYILWLDLLNGSSGQAPVFYNLPVAAAAWLVATRPGRRSAGLMAMALIGVALQIKPAAVFEGVFLGLWLLAGDWRARRSGPGLLAYAAGLVALALLPTAAAWGFYAAQGWGDAWWQANVTAVLGRRGEPAVLLLHNATKLVLVLSPLLGMAAASRGQAEGGDSNVRVFLFFWLAVAVGGVVAFGGWFDHYGLPIVTPAAVCASGFFAGRGRRFAAPILLAAALAGQIKVGLDRRNRGDGADLARLVAAIGRGPGALWVYSGEPLLYAETGRPALSRYLLPSHLYLAREDGSVGVSQAAEVRRILATRPAVIVVAPRYRLERPDIRAIVGQALARDYRLTDRVPFGGGVVDIYRLKRPADGGR